MGITLDQIRRGLAATIETYTERTIYANPKVVGDGPLPAVLIEPDDSHFDLAFNKGEDSYEFKLYVLAPASGDEVLAQDILDEFVTGTGPSSIREAIYDHEDLGLGDAVEAIVYKMEKYGGSAQWYGVDHIGAILRCRVFVDNSAD